MTYRVGGRPWWLLSAFCARTVLQTRPPSNQAAAVAVLLVIIEMAQQVGANPRSSAMK
jgi:di/tricarboxylate transporter